MQARRAARELALIMFSQTDFIPDLNKADFKDIILKSVRTLTNNSSEELKTAYAELASIKDFLADYEANHPTNLERPIGVSDIPVPIPMTSDMEGKIDKLMDIADKAMLALEIAEMSALEENDDVKNYIKKISEAYKTHKTEIDEMIQKYAFGWDINRLVKTDKDILRMAICELVYVQDAPLKVVIDEALELAKKYSTDDSASFINGILGKVVLENDLK